MERRCRDIGSRTRVLRTLDDGRAVLLASVGYHAEPVAGPPGVCQDIQCLACEARWCIAGRLAELAVRAVAVEPRGRGEGNALVVLLDDVAAFDGPNVSAHESAPAGDRVVFCVRPFV